MNAELQAFYDHASTHRCLVPGCSERAELHHVMGGISFKSGSYLPKRNKHGIALCVPLCPEHHRTGRDSVHALSEEAFEMHHGLPIGHLLRYAASLLAEYVVGPQ